LKSLRTRNPASLKICTLLNKQARRILEVEDVAYKGFEIDDHFVVGYGLDYMQKFRNLPCIGILKPSVYQKF
ncbi:MAG TPA: hypoxanthine phosphoribosyltransferase, partial [Candidatus Obscuribacterales bacterium]